MSDPGNDKAGVLAMQTGNDELERLRRENEGFARATNRRTSPSLTSVASNRGIRPA